MAGIRNVARTIGRRSKALGRGADQAPMFHGSEVAWPGHRPGAITVGNKTENIYGPGLYMTSHREIAANYTGLSTQVIGRGKQGYRYGFKWRNRPNLIDLDQPLSDDVMGIFRPYLDKVDRAAGAAYVSRGDLPGTDIYSDLIAYERGGPGGEKSLLGLSKDLRSGGYHGFTHKGGVISAEQTGSELRHKVSIAFDPQRDITTVGYDKIGTDPLTRRVSRQKFDIAKWRTKIDEGYGVPGAVDTWNGEIKKIQGQMAPVRELRSSFVGPKVRANVRRSRVAREAHRANFQRAPSSGRMGGVPSRNFEA